MTPFSPSAITSNGNAVPRQNSLFYDQLPVDNSGAAQYQSLNVQGVNTAAGVTVDELRHAFLPKSPEVFVHDADGNLTDDARWHYTWDAENRLVEMQTSTTSVAAGVPKKRLVFAYDALGRRIAKRVMGWDSIANAWGVQASTLFLYDGWNLVAELNSLSTITLTRSYAWGLDLSGSLQGAGGVGGLLLSTFNSQPSTYASAYDGNGNVIGYVDMVTGTRAAAYEYNAFGETLIAEGQVSDQLPFRFSTKFSDGETGLLYYGLRYYSPTAGGWLNRDPIGESGGSNLYRMAVNDVINNYDYLGMLLPVDSDFQPASAVGASWKWGYATDAYAWTGNPDDQNDGPSIDLTFTVEDCHCLLGKLTLKQQIYRNIWGVGAAAGMAKGLTWENIYGHEQQHITSALAEFRRVRALIERETACFDSDEAARIAAAQYRAKYVDILVRYMKRESGHGNPASPKARSPGIPLNPPPIDPLPGPHVPDTQNPPIP